MFLLVMMDLPQPIWANPQETIPRRLGSLLATHFIEGWAFYCEELLEQPGYIAQPIQRLGQLSGQLWRAACIILDTSLHIKGMSVEEAVDSLIGECQLEPTNALAEARRCTQTPTQPQSYLTGKLAILELVADYRRAHPEASLRDVHDAILGCGSCRPGSHLSNLDCSGRTRFRTAETQQGFVPTAVPPSSLCITWRIDGHTCFSF